VSRLLRQLGYSPKVNARRKEARASPEQRDEQFCHIEQQTMNPANASATRR
jgi:hypothetical protein